MEAYHDAAREALGPRAIPRDSEGKRSPCSVVCVSKCLGFIVIAPDMIDLDVAGRHVGG